MKRGVVTLSILLMLSALFTLALLFQEQNLAFLRHQNALRKNYTLDFWKLQKLTEAKDVCEHIEASQQAIVFHQTLVTGNEDGLRQSIFCERKAEAIFNDVISRKLHEKEVKQYVDVTEFKTRSGVVIAPEKLTPTDKPQIYFVPKSKKTNYLTIQGEVHGIIVAEGELTLAGIGEFRGSIITGGGFELKGKAKLTYDAKTIKYLTGRGWTPVAQTWIDYEDD